MNNKWKYLSIITGLIIVTGLVLWGPIVSSVEKPKYQVIMSLDKIEVRQYQSMIIAEIVVTGEREEAINEGFRSLADYIFGNNISMTSPVSQQKNEKIAMTAPVSQQAVSDGWTINFVMPSEYTLDTLPKPSNDDIHLKEIPTKIFAAIRFSGLNTNQNIAKHERKLKQYLADNHLVMLSEPVYAFYNPPWTLPFLRRNEVMIEIEWSEDT